MPSSSVMVPVPAAPLTPLTPVARPEMAGVTVKVSSFSTAVSCVVCTVNVWVSLAVPVKLSAVVFAV